MAASGWEAKVRSFLPKDHQVPMAVYMGYAGIYGFFKMIGGHPKPKAPEKKEVSTPQPSSTQKGGFQLPDFDHFDEWISNESNVKKLNEILSDEKQTQQYLG